MKHTDDIENGIVEPKLIHELFSRQAARTPEAIALVFEDQRMTYGELDARSTQVARCLQAMGVGPDELVGICIDRSLEMVVGLLGILKAGGAYLPLDPNDPKERLAFVFGDALPRLVLTDRKSVSLLPAHEGVQILCFDECQDFGNEPVLSVKLREHSAAELAYVIYTSGSTGKPKGVQIPHAALTNFLRAMQNELRIESTDALLAVTTISFDIAGLEIYLPLMVGARVVLAPRATAMDGLALVRELDRHTITLMQATPTTWHLLLAAGWGGSSRLRVFCGGEPLLTKLADQLRARCAELWNMYGPTETTIWSTMAKVSTQQAEITIGSPIANTEAYILDDQLVPVPIGEPGELYLGGDGLARGYLRRPGLTAERFIPNAWSANRGARLYRTGDWVRQRPDGRIEHLGRRDQQIKLRGYRIELGEIENVLEKHETIQASVIAVHEDNDGDKLLVAYVVPRVSDLDAPNNTPITRQTSVKPAATEQSLVASLDTSTDWRAIWDRMYHHREGVDPTLNYSGWLSSYTGLTFSEAEVREAVGSAVCRILEHNPNHVLELGCGTGMLLYRIAPRCERYIGTDISEAGVQLIAETLKSGIIHLPQVELYCRAATDLTELVPRSLDTVIINSVIQYFPSVSYAIDVLERAVDLVRAGGCVFIGDVRNFLLVEAFHASVQSYQASPTLPISQLQQRILRNFDREEALTFTPEFFLALKARIPRITYVDVQLKRGIHPNENVRFRYDVRLFIDQSVNVVQSEINWSWPDDRLSLHTIRTRLAQDNPDVVCITNVPNARVAADVRALSLLWANDAPATTHELREKSREAEGQDPEAFWALANAFPYEVTIRWSTNCHEGRFDVWMVKTSQADKRRFPPEARQTPVTSEKPLHQLASRPLRNKWSHILVPQWRKYASEQLPSHMLPSVYVILDAMPLLPNGKIDRRSLPAPSRERVDVARLFLAPRTSVERELVDIWREVLGVDRVGVDDDFLELGGHSLLAMQLITRIRRAFQKELQLREVFEASTIARLAMRLQSNPGQTTTTQALPIQSVARTAPLAASFAQQRLWFLDRFEPASAFYNSPLLLQIDGVLDCDAVQMSLDMLVARHETLRTTFEERDGDVVQRIAPPLQYPVDVRDLLLDPDIALHSSAERRAMAERIVHDEAFRPIDLNAGPVARWVLVRFDPQSYFLLFAIHHIYSDGWSLEILSREFVAGYEAARTGKAIDFPALPIQYGDFAVWQRQGTQDSIFQAQQRYWQNQLANLDPLDLPTDRPRPPVMSHQGTVQRGIIPAPLTRALVNLSQREGTSLFMTMLAVFKVLLARHSGRDDIAVGTPVANRTRLEIEGIIGFFANTLVLRSRINKNPSFRTFLHHIRDVTLDAYANQDVPFERVVECIAPVRDLSRTPLFQVMFWLEKSPHNGVTLPNLTIQQVPIETGTSKFDLSLGLMELGETIAVTFEYNTDIFDGDRIERMLQQYLILLESAASNPETPIHELTLLPRAERDKLLFVWNQTSRDFVRINSAHRFFEEQTDRTPGAIAVQYGPEQLTYAELDRRANQCAHALRQCGIRPGSRVGVCVERSLDMTIAVLGILKAGAAYVPFDPAYPRERISFMVQDSRVELILTQHSQLETLSAMPIRTLCMDREIGEWPKFSAERPDVHIDKNHPAYLLYTSGSSGRPKGVLMPHGALTNLVSWQIEQTQVGAGQVALQFAPLSFDVSFQEMLATWASGGTLLLISESERRDPVALLKRICEQNVARIFLPFVALQQLVETAVTRGVIPANLREIVTAGEQLQVSPALIRFLEALPTCRLFNQYGPTESHVVAQYSSDGPISSWAAQPPIGGPIANTQLFVLDSLGNPAPIGAPGELHIGGCALAQGYWDRPGLTAQKFTPNPFATVPGSRLYRTGDLARYRSDGTIEFLGRADEQVKVRGFRVELGEIEAALLDHPALQEVAVLVSGSGANQRLIAYVVTKNAQTVAIGEAREFLANRLPEYMLPTSLVCLDALPRTPSGKVARRVLPTLMPRESSPDEFVAARSPTETTLSRIWMTLLGLPRVGMQDNFFILGGHSLLATRLASRIHSELGMELPLRRIFEAPTIEQLARSIDETRNCPIQRVTNSVFEEGEL